MAIQVFDEDSIARILNEHSAGSSLGEICFRYDISTETFYSWKLRQDVEREVVARVAEMRMKTDA